MAWAIAVCIDLTCVMAARERQRDKRTGRPVRGLSWPTLVLVGGIVLSLAANLAQAEPTAWGWLAAGTPAAAFLVAVSMLERRAAAQSQTSCPSCAAARTVPPSFGRPAAPVRPSSTPTLAPVPAEHRPEIVPPAVPAAEQRQPHSSLPDHVPAPSTAAESARPAAELIEFARRVAAEHHDKYGRPITRDVLRARLGVSNQLASDLLRQVRNQPA